MFAESTDVPAAISGALQAICTSLRWDLGVFWQVARTEGGRQPLGSLDNPVPAHPGSVAVRSSFAPRQPNEARTTGPVGVTGASLWAGIVTAAVWQAGRGG